MAQKGIVDYVPPEDRPPIKMIYDINDFESSQRSKKKNKCREYIPLKNIGGSGAPYKQINNKKHENRTEPQIELTHRTGLMKIQQPLTH